nr:reverse transcriptase domain-containing protein [Tanacetum cinerariifolium]
MSSSSCHHHHLHTVVTISFTAAQQPSPRHHIHHHHAPLPRQPPCHTRLFGQHIRGCLVVIIALPAIIEPLRIELPFLEDQFQEDPPEDPPEVLMADNRTMSELLQAPTDGYEDAIVIPEITANNFELKHGLINLVQNKQFFKHDKEDSHAHIRYFNKITSTMRVLNVPSSSIKLMLFPFSLEGAARIWLENEPPRSILTLDDLFTKFINQFFPPSKTTNLRNEITRFQALLLDKKNQSSAPAPSPTPAPVKAVEPNCVTCGEPVVAPVSALMPNLKPSIPYPSRHDNEIRRDQANEQIEKFYEIFKDEGLSLSEHTPTCITLELADHSVSKPIGIAKDVSVKTGRALIDVHKGELTLRIRNESITYNLDQTLRYSANYNQMTANKIDVIDMACEEYSQKVLGFSNVTTSGNPTPYVDLIVSTTSPTFTPFGDSNFLLFEETDAFLSLEDDPNSPKFNPFYYDLEGDILLLEAILNSEPLPPLPNHEQYMPSFKKELKVCEAKTVKSSVDEPPEVELKDLPPHLKYAFLEGDKKLPIIIAKEFEDDEKSTLIKVLKSHKRAIAWKLSNIQGINPEFCTHKILMEEDYKPAVQHQRRVNPKIHDVIKNEVEKLLDAGLIYPISDSPWVSLVHCMPNKYGFTIVENEENELILTRLVTEWRVCIDYQKLNEATRKDHFPLSFMDQMLERLAGNEYYCFLDSFSRYFQIPIDPRDQEKTTFTCPYETFAYRRMPFDLCNAPGTFQRCMLAIFDDMVEKTMQVFMDDFSVFGNSFENFLSRLDKMLQRFEDTNLCLNWRKAILWSKKALSSAIRFLRTGLRLTKPKSMLLLNYIIPQLSKVFGVFSVMPVFTDDSFRIFPKFPD